MKKHPGSYRTMVAMHLNAHADTLKMECAAFSTGKSYHYIKIASEKKHHTNWNLCGYLASDEKSPHFFWSQIIPSVLVYKRCCFR